MTLYDVEGAEELVRFLGTGAKVNIETDGHLLPVVCLVATRAPHTGRRLTEPVPLIGPGPVDEDQKQRFAAVMNTAAQKFGSWGVFLVAETWVVTGPAAARSMVRPSAHPLREEAVIITGEHRAWEGTRTWMAPITRDAKGHPICGAFNEQPRGQYEGRLTGLLPPLDSGGLS